MAHVPCRVRLHNEPPTKKTEGKSRCHDLNVRRPSYRGGWPWLTFIGVLQTKNFKLSIISRVFIGSIKRQLPNDSQVKKIIKAVNDHVHQLWKVNFVECQIEDDMVYMYSMVYSRLRRNLVLIAKVLSWLFGDMTLGSSSNLCDSNSELLVAWYERNSNEILLELRFLQEKQSYTICRVSIPKISRHPME